MKLKNFFEERAEGDLRSIVKYDGEGSEIIYLREDVVDKYTEAEIGRVTSRYRPRGCPVGGPGCRRASRGQS